MLEASFSSHNFTFRQYQNVFQFLVNSVTELSTNSILSHDQVLHTVLINDPRQCEARCMSVDAVAEMVLREVLVSALGMQALDRYAAAALRQIAMLNGRLGSQALTRMMNYDPERLVSPIHKPKPSTDDQTTLGFKGLGLKQMASYGHNVPEGFILTTELFSAMPAMSYRPLYDDTIQRIRAALGRARKADRPAPGRPGARAAALDPLRRGHLHARPHDHVRQRRPQRRAGRGAVRRSRASSWAAWDCYRRFLQSWAMSAGVDRDFFDAIMTEFKSRYGVEQKLDFTPEQMREIAFTYKDRAGEGGVVFVDDPFAPGRRLRVQGAGVVGLAARPPLPPVHRRGRGVGHRRGRAAHGLRQPEPRVGLGGDLHAQPARALQPPGAPVRRLRRAQPGRGPGRRPRLPAAHLGGAAARQPHLPRHRALPGARLPRRLPRLLSVARDLVGEREYDPQEIEFTFESPAAEDLYVLQKRAVVQELAKDAAYFDTSSPNYGPPVAVGMGVAGGAYSGRVAINAEQIDQLLAESPTTNIVLLRPDTVPEDIAIITRVSAILTARGGATSHAAVTAKRLGKTAVVDCRDLEVIEREGVARLAGSELPAGDWLSIDGRTGNIFVGRIPTLAEPALAQPAAAGGAAADGAPPGDGLAERVLSESD